MQHFTSLPDSYVTTSICSEECCTGVVLAVTSKPICLKPSTQAATGQQLIPTTRKPLKLYATYSGVKQLSGKTKTMWNRSALVEVSCCYQRTPLVYPILLKCNYIQTHRYTGIPMIFFPNLNISIKHRQIGGQSLRFAVHNRF